MAKDPAFLFYPSDFLTGTMFFSDAEIGVYVKLLCAQHQQGGSIPEDIFNSMIEGKPIIKTKFKKDEEGYYNQRLLDEMIKRKKKSDNLSKNALKRWSNTKDMQLHKKTMQLDCKSTKKGMPIEDRNENENTVNNILNELIEKSFLAVWNRYPKNRRIGKLKGLNYLKKNIKSEDDLKDFCKVADSYLESKTVKDGYAKHAERFFRDWKDYLELKESEGGQGDEFSKYYE